MKVSKGFTLIELLVVIAIIGILSSVVLNSLNTARSKANDAKTKAQLSGARAAAEVFYDSQNPPSYGIAVASLCTTANSMFTSTIGGMNQYTNASNYPNTPSIRCSSTVSDYQISVALQQNTGGANPDFWCVNSRGVSKLIEASSHAAAHPNSDIDCTP